MYAVNPIISPIKASDNVEVANIIRAGLTEYGANKPGFAWQDPQLNSLYEAYCSLNTAYWVARDQEGKILGGCGIAPLTGLNIVGELQKMYLLPEARGYGLGRQLLQHALSFARDYYSWCYLETLSTMSDAAKLYQKSGFMRLPVPLGNSGHNSCDHWYLLSLDSSGEIPAC